MSASVGGAQAKVLLTRTDTDWGWPAAGAMSTHIIKPEPISDVLVLRWEEWALRLARAAGLPAARAELVNFDGRLALVVERFDRVQDRRTHQKDFAQALGIASRDKYETTRDEHRLAAIARAAGTEALIPAAFARDLLRQVTFNKVLQTFGHHLDGQGRLPHLTATHLRTEATTWGLTDVEVCETISSVVTAVREALPACSADVIAVDRIASIIDDRAVSALMLVT